MKLKFIVKLWSTKKLHILIMERWIWKLGNACIIHTKHTPHMVSFISKTVVLHQILLTLGIITHKTVGGKHHLDQNIVSCNRLCVNFERRKYSSWLTVSEVSVHGIKLYCFWDHWEVQHDREQWGRDAYFTVARKQRHRERPGTICISKDML